jgi:uncharacterized membrane protein
LTRGYATQKFSTSIESLEEFIPPMSPALVCFPIALFSFAFAGELFGYRCDNAAARQA